MSINWKSIRYFNFSEFSEDPNVFAKPNLIYSLDCLRKVLEIIIKY